MDFPSKIKPLCDPAEEILSVVSDIYGINIDDARAMVMSQFLCVADEIERLDPDDINKSSNVTLVSFGTFYISEYYRRTGKFRHNESTED